MKRGTRTLAILALALAGCQASLLRITPTATTVAVHLASTQAVAPLVRELAAGFQEAHPDIRLALRLTVGNQAGILETLGDPAGDSPAYAVLHALPPDVTLWAAPIAIDQIALIVHPDNPATALTLEQVRAIYQGRLTDWSALGGSAGPITVLSREEGSGTRLVFESLLLGGMHVTRSARLLPSGQAVLDVVSQERGALGYVSLALANARVRPVAVDGVLPTLSASDYPFQTTVYVVGAAEPPDFLRTFIAWMQSQPGQAVVARHYLTLPE